MDRLSKKRVQMKYSNQRMCTKQLCQKVLYTKSGSMLLTAKESAVAV